MNKVHFLAIQSTARLIAVIKSVIKSQVRNRLENMNYKLIFICTRTIRTMIYDLAGSVKVCKIVNSKVKPDASIWFSIVELSETPVHLATTFTGNPYALIVTL